MSDIETIEVPDTSDVEEMPVDGQEAASQESIEDITKDGLSKIISATKASMALPTGASRDLYTAQPSFIRVMNQESDKILNILGKILKHQNIKGNIKRRDDDEKTDLILECNDSMLERINSNLDEMSGLKKAPEVVLVQAELSGNAPEKKRSSLTGKTSDAKLLTARNILRPQVNFKVPVDNRNSTPFEPKIKYKPNSLKPLAVLPEYGEDGNIESYLHPYETELNRFDVPEEQLTKTEPQKPKSLAETPLVFVDSAEKLEEIMKELEKFKEIAIDLEHHSYRSFQGFTCLMQLSTRVKDYIIDTLALREDLHVLNEVFTKPSIVKIFHGADCDIEWLQKDFSLYVVNMFDTHQAARKLNFARVSLAYLLKHFCQIEADKTFQLADWRIRPLPEELVAYARQDTHFLLYIYDMLRNELLKKANFQPNWLKSVYQQSTEICMKRYVKVRLTPESHLNLYTRSKKNFDNRQLFAFREIYNWRDVVAREEDESYGYVLPNHMLFYIAEMLPREMQGILACCNPVPPLVRQHLLHLHKIVLKARDQPLEKIIVAEERPRVAPGELININSFLYCPHDLPQGGEIKDNLPTLLAGNLLGAKSSVIRVNLVKSHPQVSVFEAPAAQKSLPKIAFVSPYQRYRAVIPIAEEEKRKAQQLEEMQKQKRRLCPDASEIVPEVLDIKQEPNFSGKRRSEGSADEVKAKIPRVETQREQPRVPEKDEKPKLSRNQRKKMKKMQAEAKLNEFDYTSVDFSKFQGGSKSGEKAGRQQYASQFRSRGQKAKNADKRLNKIFR
ncbi:exosome component 10 [Phlebotomus argentipes]|uniref:exosome component 10 n=1 Tax=Phlebotomus argentipes TaxID=94469 RepID=UPI0028937196|nr:exosome component 10 [Phlebotomus argentipes]